MRTQTTSGRSGSIMFVHVCPFSSAHAVIGVYTYMYIPNHYQLYKQRTSHFQLPINKHMQL